MKAMISKGGSFSFIPVWWSSPLPRQRRPDFYELTWARPDDHHACPGTDDLELTTKDLARIIIYETN